MTIIYNAGAIARLWREVLKMKMDKADKIKNKKIKNNDINKISE